MITASTGTPRRWRIGASIGVVEIDAQMENAARCPAPLTGLLYGEGRMVATGSSWNYR
ncbi:MAG: hypothetical protein R3E65_08360 [Steroidobacteraceae bacterium]